METALYMIYNMLLFIFRVLSAILTICVVVPLFIAYLIFDCALQIANGFTFHNFMHFEVPNAILDRTEFAEVYLSTAGLRIIIKITGIVFKPIIQMAFNFMDGIKTIKL